MKSPAAEYAAFVEHPRYGKGPRFTGLDVADSPDGRVYCHWHSPPGVRVPNTAVVADVSRQGRATLHVTHYFDAKRTCRDCGRPFLFFAEEQKHWYEDLMFPLEADCLRCAPCRKDEQRLRAIRQKYDALLEKTAPTPADTLELVECGLFLVESVVFSAKLLPKLRGLLKPLLLDVEGPYYTRAKALMATIISGLARKPDFSGEWILNREASTLSPGADGVRSGVWRIEHREPTFHHKATFVTGGNPIEYEYELRSDGPDATATEGASLEWDGNALVVTFRTRRPDGEMLISFRYELLDAGRRLRAAEQVRSTDHNQDNVWIFERR